jgi:hypothetical protein
MQSVLVIIKHYWEGIEIIGVAENLNAAKDFISKYVKDEVKNDFKTDKEFEDFMKSYKLNYLDGIYNLDYYYNNDDDDIISFSINPFEVIK